MTGQRMLERNKEYLDFLREVESTTYNPSLSKDCCVQKMFKGSIQIKEQSNKLHSHL